MPENTLNDSPMPNETREMNEEKVGRLVIEPAEEAKPFLEYLARWRAQSEKTSFSFS